MIWAFLVFALWLLAANLAALVSCPIRHNRAALALVVVGIPILGWITWLYGPVLGVLSLAIGCAALRWPLPRLIAGGARAHVQEPAE